MNELAIIENHRPALTAGSRPAAIVPTDMDSAYRLAKAVCMAGMAPKGLDTPEKAMVAIMHGLELGLTPMAALQRIAVVNGRPTIWGDGAIGLVRGSGVCEWIKERIDGQGDSRVAVCEAKRRGEPESIVGRFSVAHAKKAGLWGKAGPWQQYEERMLQMRARAFCLRDGFADVLGGLYLREELEEAPFPSSQAPSPPTPPAPPRPASAAIEYMPNARERAESAPAPEAEPESDRPAAQIPPTPPKPPVPPKAMKQEPQAADPEALRKRFEQAAAAAQDMDALNEAWETIVEPVKDHLLPPDQEDLLGVWRRREREMEP